MDVFSTIKEILDNNDLAYKVEDHEPTPRSIDSARIRGTPIEQGAKAIVLRSEGKFLMCVLPGDKKIDYHKIKGVIGSKSVSLATPEQVKETTGCAIGGVPPFGTIFNIPLYVERSLLRNEQVSFNAGMLTRSITMRSDDYIRVSKGELVEFAL